MKGFSILLIVFYLSVFNFALVANPLDVVINEIAWMGNQESNSKEWIELYNNTDSDIDMNGWKIIADDNTPNIVLSGIIPGRGFYLLERTDDQTIPEIAANQIYAGALENSGENLKLINKEGVLVDEIIAAEAWPAGDNSTKQTMETIRQAQGENRGWQTSQNPGGTPKSQNSAGVTAKSGTGQIAEVSQNPPEPIVEQIEMTPTGNSAEAKSLQIENYPNGIVLNEILPSPEGPDKTEEWIEIYNQNDFPVDLSGWQINDSFGQTKTYYFPENSIIFPKSYLIIKRPESGIVLNNQEERLLMISPDKKVVDSVYYKNAVRGQSFARFADQWTWTKKLTPANLNVREDSLEKAKANQDDEKEEEIPLTTSAALTANVFQGSIEEDSRFLRVFGLAVLIAALSGIAILMLKRLIRTIASQEP